MHEDNTRTKESSIPLLLPQKDTVEVISLPATWKGLHRIPAMLAHSAVRLPALRTVRNTCLLFISHPFYGVLLEQPEQTFVLILEKSKFMFS